MAAETRRVDVSPAPLGRSAQEAAQVAQQASEQAATLPLSPPGVAGVRSAAGAVADRDVGADVVALAADLHEEDLQWGQELYTGLTPIASIETDFDLALDSMPSHLLKGPQHH